MADEHKDGPASTASEPELAAVGVAPTAAADTTVVTNKRRKGNGEEDDINEWPWHLKMKERGGLDVLNGTSHGPEDGGFFVRSYWVTGNGFLRATAFEVNDVPKDTRVETAEEKTAAIAQGDSRWKALHEGLDLAQQLDECFDPSAMTDQFFYYGYGESVPFSFSIPPGTQERKPDWDLNDVLQAAHPENEEENVDEDKKGLFDDGSCLTLASGEAFTEATKKHAAEILANHGEENQKSVEGAAKIAAKLLELPRFAELRWGAGEGSNCDATVDVLYYEDREAGVISGCFIFKAW